MFTYVFLAILLAGNALAAPNPIGNQFRHDTQLVQVKRDTPFSSAAYGMFPQAITSTVTVIVTATVTAAVATTTSAVTTSSATIPLPTTTSIPEPEEKAGVYICEDHNWGGKCEHHLSPLGSSEEDCTQLDGTASSIGPDIGFQCLFFTNSYCRPLASDGSDTLGLTYPGNANLLVTENGNFNDKVYSYLCFKLDSQ
ncbi:Nn.00g092750.m01.CDS01 [Neocucurbitaria sp. VM-36]